MDLWLQALGRPGEAPEQCTPEVMHDIVQQHMDSPAMWAIFPLQVLLTTLTLDAAMHHLQFNALLVRSSLRAGCQEHAWQSELGKHAYVILWTLCPLQGVHTGCQRFMRACAYGKDGEMFCCRICWRCQTSTTGAPLQRRPSMIQRCASTTGGTGVT